MNDGRSLTYDERIAAGTLVRAISETHLAGRDCGRAGCNGQELTEQLKTALAALYRALAIVESRT